jgi:LPXTG-motif cell wall-anchored protein
MSKLDMKNTFAIINATGSHASTGYSTMVYGPFTQVTHGFPGLTYKDTRSIRSDPEITVYYNQISVNPSSPSNNGPPDMLILIIVLGAITAVGAVFILRRKKKRAKE